MKKTKKAFSLCMAAFGVSAALFAGVAITWSAAEAKAPYGDAFDYTQSVAPIKYKTMQSDVSEPTKKGLLLYAYDSGASATFKASFNGEFKASLKPISVGNQPDLVKYSLVFKDKAVGNQFSVTVAGSGSYSDVYVTVNGESAGIHYFEDTWSGGAYGYTAAYNKEGAYTRFADGEAAELLFNPQTMQVYVMGDNGAYRLVWDFTKAYNDGKLLSHNLTRFSEYTVDVVFDEVKSNGKGELLVYTFGDYTFNKAFMDSKPTISASVRANAVVGQEYIAPTATATDLIQGELAQEDMQLVVYDDYGNIVNGNGGYTFTPTHAGIYYLYYSCGENEEQASAFYRIEAIEESSVTQSFTYDVALNDAELGVQSTVYVPVAEVNSSLSADGYSAEALVTVKKDGAIVKGFENCAGGFEYTFSDAGEYEFLYQTETFGVPMSETKRVTVSNDVANIVADEIAESVEYMSTITVKPAKIYYAGEVISSKVTLVYPSGKVEQAGDCLLDELGNYTIVHEYNGNTFEQFFSVKQYFGDMFTSDASSVEYGAMSSNNLVKGQMLSLANDDVLTYNKVLDFSDNVFDDSLEDKLQNTPFIELFMQPKSIGMVDVSGLYVVLTDATDPTNYIEIRIQYLSYLPNNMRIRTRAAGQSWVGYNYDFWTGEVGVDSAQSHSDGGTIVSLNPSHTIVSKEFTTASLKLYFDNEKGCLYTKTWQDKAGNSTADNYIPIPWLIRDFKTNDRLLSAEDTPWKGFATGKVYLSVYATGVTDKANIMVLSIDGEDLTQPFVSDTDAPIITVKANEELPYAEVGTPFKVFDFLAEDGYAAVVEKSVKVYRGKTELTVSADGTFVPDSVGEYSIVYAAKDAFGNVANKTVVIEARNSIPNPEIEILGNLPETATFGDTIYLPDYYGYGGAGDVQVSVKVTAINTGEEIPVQHGQFVCLQEGDYMVEYTARDYIGNVKTSYQWIYDVTRQTTPVFDETQLVLPKVFIVGDAYNFKQYKAVYYTADGVAEEIVGKVTVTDASGTDVAINGAYTPKASETVQTAIVKFTFEKSATRKTVIEREIPILTIQQGQLGFLTKFFVSENAEVEAKNEAIYFTAIAGENAKYSFAKMVNEKYLTIGLKRNDAKDFNVIKITVRDVYESEAMVTFTFTNTEKGLTCSINGNKASTANYDSTGKFGFTYDATTKNVLDVLGMKIGTIDTYANGESFAGFPNGAVYLDFETDGCVGLNLISNQTFNNYIRDAITPRITVNGSFTGTYVPGQQIVFPTASAYDVLSAIGEVKLTVKNESGETLLTATADKETIFVPEQYGTYSVSYSVTDASNNRISFSTSIVVNDDVKPTLTFNGEVPETAAWGSTLKLPTYTINDNGDTTKATVKVYVCAPDGIMTLVTDGQVHLNRKGEYTIYYFVMDENNNPTNYTFYVQVK